MFAERMMMLLIDALKCKRYMREYHVDEEKIRQFVQEYRLDPTKRIGEIILAEQWLFKKSILGDCLLPVEEVVRVDLYGAPKREETMIIDGAFTTITVPADFRIKVRFCNGAAITVPCAGNPDRAMGMFAQHCPQAKFGHHEHRENLYDKKGVYP